MIQPAGPNGPIVPGAVPKGDQAFAQFIYLAQISALKGGCNCNTCKIMRKASDAIVTKFTETAPGPESIDNAIAKAAETIDLNQK